MPEEKASSAILAIDSDRIPLSPTRAQPIMPALKTRFIINPRSGRVQRHLANIQTFARRRGMETVCSERPATPPSSPGSRSPMAASG
jgi:hypothetical protein